MHYIVAYDICNPSRLRKVARICEDYGLRIQKSVFECDLSAELMKEMLERLKEVVEEKKDSILSQPLCRACCASRSEIGPSLFSAVPDVLVA
jgi:CRISPR-associated protein Cas2